MHLFASLYPLCYTVYGFLRENEEINMKTIVVTLDKEHPDGEAILRAGEIIKAGGLVAFPTETVYGLGGDALNPESSRKIYAAKGRPSDNPLIAHVSCLEEIAPLVSNMPENGKKLAKAYWPRMHRARGRRGRLFR